jgi:hypothetical protein
MSDNSGVELHKFFNIFTKSLSMNINLYYYYWVDISAGGLFVPEGIIRTAGSASTLT